MTSDIKAQIVSFACHLDDPGQDPEQKARDRHWIDDAGSPTRDGVQLAIALWEQFGTRSTFRLV